MNRLTGCIPGLLLLMLCLSQAGKAAQQYTFADINFPGAVFTEPTSINDSGMIVGFYSNNPAQLAGSHGFSLKNGIFTTIDYPGAAGTILQSVNSNGQIVGFYITNPTSVHGYGYSYPFLFQGGAFTALPEVPGSYQGSTMPYGINDAGQIVGAYVDQCYCRSRGFVLTGGNFTLIDAPGYSSTSLWGINNSGTIIGFEDPGWGSGNGNGISLAGGVYTTINDPLGNRSVPKGISNAGDIVGYYYGTGIHGFVLSGGAYTTVDVPNSVETDGFGISSSGQIVGAYGDSSGNPHGFLATPAPPPNQPPVALCKSVTAPAGPSCTANVSIDNGSYDPDSGDTITLGQSPAAPYGLGTRYVTLTATDNHGASSQCTATVAVTDQTPPSIGATSASPSSLWPPNHKMVPVTLTASASDNCGAVSCQIVSVSSNEPLDADGDWVITGNLTLNLRSDRLGNGTGRVYTITIRCTDGSGNSSTKTVNVTVPHDQGN